MSKKRVVVTGLGILSPVGNEIETAWKSILEGKSGIGMIDTFDTSAYTTQFAGMLKDFDVSQYFEERDAKKMDLFIQYGIAAGVQAMRDSFR